MIGSGQVQVEIASHSARTIRCEDDALGADERSGVGVFGGRVHTSVDAFGVAEHPVRVRRLPKVQPTERPDSIRGEPQRIVGETRSQLIRGGVQSGERPRIARHPADKVRNVQVGPQAALADREHDAAPVGRNARSPFERLRVDAALGLGAKRVWSVPNRVANLFRALNVVVPNPVGVLRLAPEVRPEPQPSDEEAGREQREDDRQVLSEVAQQGRSLSVRSS